MLFEVRRDLTSVKINSKKHLTQALDRLAALFTDGIPSGEVVSWPVKEEVARRYISGSATADDEDMLRAEASLTGESPSELAQRIVISASIYRRAAAEIAGARRKFSKDIDQALSVTDVENKMAEFQAFVNSFEARYGAF